MEEAERVMLILAVGSATAAKHLLSRGHRRRRLSAEKQPSVSDASAVDPDWFDRSRATRQRGWQHVAPVDVWWSPLESDDGTPAPRLSPPRLALLAVLASAGDRGVSRERLVGLFWPDSDEPRARHSLRQALYAVQQDLHGDVIQSTGGTIALDNAALTSDVADFRSAVTAGNRAQAVELMRGPFLDGFDLPGAPEFERWVEEERGRLSSATVSALLALASEATRAQQLDAAVEWWRQLTAADPVSGRFALGYLKALAARGHRAEALAFAKQHEALVRRELEADPDPDVRRLEAELRMMPSPAVIRFIATPAPAASGFRHPTRHRAGMPTAVCRRDDREANEEPDAAGGGRGPRSRFSGNARATARMDRDAARAHAGRRLHPGGGRT